MRIFSGWDKLIEQMAQQASMLTVGSFDGVHRGHQHLLTQLVSEARNLHVPSLVLSFQPHPQVFFQSTDFALITTDADKIGYLENLGVDNLGLIPFDAELANLSAIDFIQLLRSKLKPRGVVVGKDHGFGLHRQGGVAQLLQMHSAASWRIVVVEDELYLGTKVSSSRIRAAMHKHDIPKVNALLNRVYSYSGTVIKGKQKGRSLGFPTANIYNPESNLLCPPRGVYAVEVELEDENELYLGMLNIGLRPTFSESPKPVVEVYILDFDREIYGAKLRVFFYDYLRDEQKFPSIQALVEQLNRDRARVAAYFRARQVPELI